MRIDGRNFRTLWPDSDGARIHVIDQTCCRTVSERPARSHLPPTPLARSPRHDRARRAADRRDWTLRTRVCGRSKVLPTRNSRTPTTFFWRRARPPPTCAGRFDRVRALLQRRRRAEARKPPGANRRIDEDVYSARPSAKHGCADRGSRAPHLQAGPSTSPHCNAGWLATIDWGTALAPLIYKAARKGVDLHRLGRRDAPRATGGEPLTAFELLKACRIP